VRRIVDPSNLYHTGIVVDDVPAAMEWFEKAVGYRWCEPFTAEQLVRLEDGERTLTIQGTYSMDEPRLELVGAIEGTLWRPASAGVHHLGYWSDDVDEDIAAVSALGGRVEARSLLPDGSSLWAYCRSGVGARIEFVSRALEPIMSAWFATGRFG
jgi:predicted enzyme related to lactoylglutathione lyase